MAPFIMETKLPSMQTCLLYTSPEGTTAIAIAQKMEAAGLCSAEDFLKEANEGDFSEYTFWQYVPDLSLIHI